MNKTALKIGVEIQKEIANIFSSDSIKEFVASTKGAEDSGRFEMIITTESIDRMGEVIKADGWDFTNYMNNPIVLWGHDYHMLPVGITETLEKIDGNKWLAKGKFAPASANPLAQQARQLYDLGILRASSVGFMEKEREGNLITKAELLEWSFVTVPANPMALSAIKEANLSVEEFITKGLMIKEVDEVPSETTATTEPTVDPVIAEEKIFVSNKEVVDAFSKVKEAIVALEGLLTKETPERNDPTPPVEEPKPVVEVPPVEESQEQKALREFVEKRRILQLAATVLSDVLAETRKAINIGK